MSYKRLKKIIFRGLSGKLVMHYAYVRLHRYEGECIKYENEIPEHIENIFKTKDNTHSRIADWTTHYKKVDIKELMKNSK